MPFATSRQETRVNAICTSLSLSPEGQRAYIYISKFVYCMKLKLTSYMYT